MASVAIRRAFNGFNLNPDDPNVLSPLKKYEASMKTADCNLTDEEVSEAIGPSEARVRCPLHARPQRGHGAQRRGRGQAPVLGQPPHLRQTQARTSADTLQTENILSLSSGKLVMTRHVSDVCLMIDNVVQYSLRTLLYRC